LKKYLTVCHYLEIQPELTRQTELFIQDYEAIPSMYELNTALDYLPQDHEFMSMLIEGIQEDEQKGKLPKVW